jgi:hypothetical protein
MKVVEAIFRLDRLTAHLEACHYQRESSLKSLELYFDMPQVLV